MRKMKRSDVREWMPGDSLERVDFGGGVTGMDKSIPRQSGKTGDLNRLVWKCRAIEADGGPRIEVRPSEYWIGGMKQDGYYDVAAGTSNSGQYRSADAVAASDGYLGKSGSNRNVPTQRAMDLGLFHIKETTVTHADGHTTVSRTPKVTSKGQCYFIDRYWGRTQPTLEEGA